jgi:hypothetical protein
VARGILGALTVAVLIGLPGNRFAPWSRLATAPTAERARLYAAMARLERLDSAIRVFYLDAGTFPESMGTLVDNGYLDEAALTDPWGRPFQLVVSPGGYQLVGLDAQGQVRPGLAMSRGFTESQRLLLQLEPASP